MKVTEQQLIVLHQTCVDSLKIADRASIFTYGREERAQVAQMVFAQSSNLIVSVATQPTELETPGGEKK